MDRGKFVTGLWWFGIAWTVLGVFALAYAFIVDGSAETYMRHVGLAVAVLLAPGIIAMLLSLFLESR